MRKFNLILTMTSLMALSMIVSCTKEEPKALVTDIKIKTPATKAEYYLGENLELKGMVVTLTYNNGNTEDVPYESFDSKGISTVPLNGSVLADKVDLSFRHADLASVKTVPITYKTMQDIENNSYTIVKIGQQYWMGENLKTTKYSNGDNIGTTTPANKDVSGEATPKYQWAYDGIESNVETYGRLYTGYAATDNRKLCPTGWHLPTKSELTALINYLGGESVAGLKLKEVGTKHWNEPNITSDNSGFRALPGGYRSYSGQVTGLKYEAAFFSATEYSSTDYYNLIIYASEGKAALYGGSKNFGKSVRCIKD